MILSSVNCKRCQRQILHIEANLKDNTNEFRDGDCEHFNYCCTFIIKEQKFIKCKIISTCKKCKKCFDEEYNDNSKTLNYKCECGFDFDFVYRISDETEIIQNLDHSIKYRTPDILEKEEEMKDKMNIIFIYNFKSYNYVINNGETIISQYRAIRDKIKFPDGKKLYFNSELLDVYKSFEDNHLYNNMKVEIV